MHSLSTWLFSVEVGNNSLEADCHHSGRGTSTVDRNCFTIETSNLIGGDGASALHRGTAHVRVALCQCYFNTGASSASLC